MQKTQKAKQGFSLVEFIVVVAVALILALAMARFQHDVLKMNRTTREGLRLENELRRTIITIATEIRNAKSSATGSYPVEAAGTSTLVFYSDTTGDRIAERVRYWKEGGDLKRGETSPSGAPLTYDLAEEKTKIVAHYIVSTTTPVFAYYDGSPSGSGNLLSSPLDVSKIRMIEVSISEDKDVNDPPEALTGSTFVTIRQLKDNL